MKKTYITPKLKVKHIKPMNILAGSPSASNIETNTETQIMESKEGNGFNWGDPEEE